MGGCRDQIVNALLNCLRQLETKDIAKNWDHTLSSLPAVKKIKRNKTTMLHGRYVKEKLNKNLAKKLLFFHPSSLRLNFFGFLPPSSVFIESVNNPPHHT